MAGLSNLKALELRSTADRISDELRQMIIDGTLRPGEQLGEAKIAGQLGVSRAPVREALQQLVQERLVVAARNKGVSVVSFTPDDIREIYDARLAMEKHAASQIVSGGSAARSSAAKQLSRILPSLADAIRAGDRRQVSAIDLEFHTGLIAAAGNSRLLHAYTILSAEALACINRLEIAYPAGLDLVADHEHLIELLVGGNLDEILDALSSHLNVAATRLTSPLPAVGP
ncbi:GntR family transcriptional regulator [Leifsonia sp. 2MCAF36]|uniref:GntR family transcriptional regulator n=1 Tax=Leifsonia sp. 2MCAF36 TaxID=3232988 RepID=UPI003F9E441E